MKKGDPKVINGWAMYDWANSVYSLTITSAVFPMFYVAVTMDGNTDLVQQRHGLPAASLYSYALSAGFLIVAVIAPLLSGIADRTDSKKKFLKTFCYIGSVACGLLYFFNLDNLWFGLSMVALACVGFAGSLVFYDAFLPEIAAPKDHDRISAKGYTMGYIGSVILLIINLAMVMDPDSDGISLLGIQTHGGLAARLTFVTVALWWAGFAQIPFKRLPDSVHPRKATNEIIKSGYRELRKVWRELRSTRRLKRYLIAFFVFNTGIQTVMYLAVTFAKQEVQEVNAEGVLGPISDTSLIVSILIIQLVAAVGAFLFFKLSSRVGNLRALMVAAVIWVIACLFAYQLEFATEFYMLAGIVGLVMGGSQALSRSTYSKFLPETIDHASYFSFYDVSFYLGTVLGTFVYGLVYHLTGDLRNTVIAIGTFFVVGLVLLAMVPREEVVLDRS